MGNIYVLHICTCYNVSMVLYIMEVQLEAKISVLYRFKCETWSAKAQSACCCTWDLVRWSTASILLYLDAVRWSTASMLLYLGRSVVKYTFYLSRPWWGEVELACSVYLGRGEVRHCQHTEMVDCTDIGVHHSVILEQEQLHQQRDWSFLFLFNFQLLKNS